MTATAKAPTASKARSAAVKAALAKVGEKRYDYGHWFEKGHGSDCSGLVYYAYRKAGLKKLVRGDADYYLKHSKRITKKKHKAGDLVFWKIGKRTGHVAIYIGNGKMMEVLPVSRVVKRKLSSMPKPSAYGDIAARYAR